MIAILTPRSISGAPVGSNHMPTLHSQAAAPRLAVTSGELFAAARQRLAPMIVADAELNCRQDGRRREQQPQTDRSTAAGRKLRDFR